MPRGRVDTELGQANTSRMRTLSARTILQADPDGRRHTRYHQDKFKSIRIQTTLGPGLNFQADPDRIVIKPIVCHLKPGV